MKSKKLLKTLSIGALIGIGVFSLASCNNDTEESSVDNSTLIFGDGGSTSLMSLVTTSDDDTYTITATIGPDYATDLTVDWTEAWTDTSVDDTVTDYCTIAESDDTLTCTVTCVAAFSNQITITATSNSDTSLTATTTVDYLPKYWGTYTNDADEGESDLSTMTISDFMSEYLSTDNFTQGTGSVTATMTISNVYFTYDVTTSNMVDYYLDDYSSDTFEELFAAIADSEDSDNVYDFLAKDNFDIAFDYTYTYDSTSYTEESEDLLEILDKELSQYIIFDDAVTATSLSTDTSSIVF